MQPSKSKIGIVGIPYDKNSSFLSGTKKGPEAIVSALYSDSSNLFSEDLTDLADQNTLSYIGNIPIENFEPDITSYITEALNQYNTIISLGGDHSITNPVIKGFLQKRNDFSILHFDAHPDLYNNFQDNIYSHASPFARIMESSFAGELIQVGIRTLNQHQKKQAEKHNVKIIPMNNWDQIKNIELKKPLYISLDLDVLDPAFAPGISHYEPGGASVRQVLDVIQNLNVPIIGADIVELNPTRDTAGITAMVAAKFLKEIAAKMLKFNH